LTPEVGLFLCLLCAMQGNLHCISS